MSNVVIGSYALVTLGELKDDLGIDPANGNKDRLMIRLINRISKLVENWLSRNIKARDYIEDYDGSGSDTLQLRQYPINSLAYVREDEARLFPESTAIVLTDLMYTDDYGSQGKIRRKGTTLMIDEETGRVLRYSVFGKGRLNIRVSYNAGFASTPDDIIQAVLEEVAHRYLVLDEKRLGIVSKGAMGETITYHEGGLLPSVLETISQYQNFNVAK